MDNGASVAIQEFIALRRDLLANPRAGLWIEPVATYADLAADLADRSVFWESGWATDTSAFDSQRHQAEQAGATLGQAAAQLDTASPDLALDAGWMDQVLRAMEQVALIAGAWDEGTEVLRSARSQLATNLAQSARDVIETAGETIERTSESPVTWFMLAGGIIVAGVIAVRVAVR